MKKARYACGSPEHAISRRQFLGAAAVAGGASLGFGQFIEPATASQLERNQKRVLLIFLHGGVSQLETWDPKPGTSTGGPFQAIPTSVTGTHISELLPYTARHMHRLALVRSINTRENNHSKGAYYMQTGRRETPAEDWPHLGSVVARYLAPERNPMPGYIHITPRGRSGFNREDAAFLGPRYASVTLGDGDVPANLNRPNDLSANADQQRQDFRELLNDRFTQRRRTADTQAYTYSYEQAAQIMARRAVFDINREAPRLRDQYGHHDFGRHCLLARRLLESGVTFAKVTHRNYDTHHENFDFHIEQLGEFDRTFATLMDDLHQRGMLDSTLVVVMAEFGRTPRINQRMGRDHWGTAWSAALAGCGIHGGAVVGRTNSGGTRVTDREVSAGHLFHTYMQALGIRRRNHYVDNRPIPIADPETSAISELLT